MKTIKVVGRVAIALVDDAQGTRVALANMTSPDVAESAIVLAGTRSELRAVITELRSLVEQLPEGATA